MLGAKFDEVIIVVVGAPRRGDSDAARDTSYQNCFLTLIIATVC